MSNQKIEVETPVGKIVVSKATDPEYPGIFIDLERDGKSLSIASVGCDKITKYNTEFGTDTHNEIWVYIWGDSLQEDYTRKIEIENIEEAYAKWDE